MDTNKIIEVIKRRQEFGEDKLDITLPFYALDAVGMSSEKVKQILNDICAAVDPLVYLEVGLFKGSTFINALVSNLDHLQEAYGVDNWSEFTADNPKKQFFEQAEMCLSLSKRENIHIFETNCWELDLNLIKHPVNVFLYDGNHSVEAQKKAFTYFDSVLADTFVVIVDDWNWEGVRTGTREAFKELKYNIVEEVELHTPHERNCSTGSWWNGLLIALIKKAKL